MGTEKIPKNLCSNMEANELIHTQLVKKKVKRDVDVKELYLADGNLKNVPDLAHFKNLQYLWMNGNKLERITCLHGNLRLSELYLQHNALKSICGALAHLTCLKVLLLHNNQLEKLDKVVHELRSMHTLHTLNLHNNPVWQEPEYRVYVVHRVPSVQLLDRQEVIKQERDVGRKLYDQTQETIKETIAFGRRSQGPPSIYYPGAADNVKKTEPVNYEIGNNFYRDNPVYSCEEQAVNARMMRRAVMEHTFFDWSRVPRADERRLSDKQFDSPQTITTRFR